MVNCSTLTIFGQFGSEEGPSNGPMSRTSVRTACMKTVYRLFGKIRELLHNGMGIRNVQMELNSVSA